MALRNYLEINGKQYPIQFQSYGESVTRPGEINYTPGGDADVSYAPQGIQSWQFSLRVYPSATSPTGTLHELRELYRAGGSFALLMPDATATVPAVFERMEIKPYTPMLTGTVPFTVQVQIRSLSKDAHL